MGEKGGSKRRRSHLAIRLGWKSRLGESRDEIPRPFRYLGRSSWLLLDLLPSSYLSAVVFHIGPASLRILSATSCILFS